MNDVHVVYLLPVTKYVVFNKKDSGLNYEIFVTL